jgi:DNA-binding winged helix-turn-helix (wHTH) protein/Tfp pilus assembly protein PilF
MSNSVKHFYEFGPYRLDVANRLLLRGGETLPLTPKAVDTLLALIQHGGEVIRKDDLMKLVWPDHVVEEGNLTQNIYLLRKALSDGSHGQKYIETVARRGYRFVGEVRATQDEGNGNVEKRGLTENGSLTSSSSPHLVIASLDTPSPDTTRSLASSLPRRRRLNTLILPCAAVLIVSAALFYMAFAGKQRSAETFALRLNNAEQKLPTEQPIENSEASQAYLKGRYYWSKQTAPALEEAIKYFEQALSYDPDYALAYAGLADAYSVLGSHYDTLEQSQSDAMPKAKDAALHALKLNDLSAEAHTALGVVRQRYDWDWAGAENEFKRAIELNPNYAYAHQSYALHLTAMGQLAAAKTEIKRALELDPQSLSINRDLGRIFYFAREYDQAIEQFRLALRIDSFEPLAIPLRRLLGWTYLAHGMHEQASAEFIEILQLQKTSPERIDALRQAYNAAGMRGYWHKWLELQNERIKRGQLSPFYAAQIYAFLDEKDQAFAYLQKAYTDRSLGLAALRYDPVFDNLRADARYTSLMQRIGLTP